MPGETGADEHQRANRQVDAAGQKHESHADGDDDSRRRLRQDLCGVVARQEAVRLEPDGENEHQEQRYGAACSARSTEPVTRMPENPVC